MSATGWAARICACSSFLLGMAGCGGDDEPPSPSSAGTGGGGSGNAGGTSSVAGAASGGGSAQGGSAAAGAGGVAGLAPLVPLVTGNRWSFVFKPIDSAQPSRETCEAPSAEVGAQTTSVDGKSGYLYTTPCGADPYLVEGSGDQLLAHRLVQGVVVATYEYIHSPVAEGEQWTTNGGLYEWRRLSAKLDVPAGSFDDCWERHSDDLNLVYCRGVGLVRTTSTPNNYVLELTARNF